ncbi:FG-GAP repeat domain-containing protein [Bifidobacterium sp.]|uniref:FG-GAP repeat domain-containing protein n=1 Tax=Bifidobacterium sp. TaxID=41200 RepID=UPI0039EC7DE6
MVSIIVFCIGLAGVNSQAQAADATQFNAGEIISDANFYDSDSMTAAEVQAFLNAKVPTCKPQLDSDPSSIVCLKNYTATTVAKSKDSYCNGYTGGVKQTAAQIIDGVARSCGVSQKVLLVLLQKENGLVTHVDPSPWRYTTAMGFGCPDTAACNSQYYGFFNQTYAAARQYKLYKANPSDYQYRIGNNSIYWSPTLSCGSSVVKIVNQATAGLYNYTPYQPNKAALEAGYGTGNSCSSYGNRNFFLYYSDWFGSPTGTPAPSTVGRTYYFSNSLTSSVASSVVVYGAATDAVYSGDWNGDGKDTLVVRRGNVYYFKDSLTGGQADETLVYGKDSDVLLIGDWNGDGKDTLAVRRGNVYYFKDSLTGGQADETLVYGKATDDVVVGDWNGDGKDTLAVRRGGTYYFKNSLTGSGEADEVLVYGRSTDSVLVGDWDGNGTDTLAVRR